MDESSASPARVSPVNSDSEGPAANRDAVWKDCLERIKGGDQAALAEFYNETCSLVFGIAQRVLESRADAEEISLDVYKQIWRGARSYDGARGSVAAWLIMLARTRAIDRRRSRASQDRAEVSWHRESERTGDSSGFERNSLIRLDYQRVSAALAQIPEEQRQVIELAFFQGLSHSEMAGHLLLPLGTVKTRIRQGMIKLRDMLGTSF